MATENDPAEGAEPKTCSANLETTADLASTPFLLHLRDGGDAESTDWVLDSTFTFLGTCVEPILHTSDCTKLVSDGVACTGTCGICTCTGTSALMHKGTDYAWSASGSTFTIASSGVQMDYSYCANLIQFRLRTDGLELQFERVEVGGAKTCTIDDYGKLPECEIFPANTKCGGAAKSCSEYSFAECETVDGCSTSEACLGPDWDCADLCAIGYGCSESTGCQGVGSCKYSKAAGSCYASYGCTWTQSCVGFVPACSSYTVGHCLEHPGCVIEPP